MATRWCARCTCRFSTRRLWRGAGVDWRRQLSPRREESGTACWPAACCSRLRLQRRLLPAVRQREQALQARCRGEQHLWCHGARYVHMDSRVHTVAQQLPCASVTYATQEARTRSLYVQYGGSGAYGSAQSSTSSGGSSHSTQATSAPMSRTCRLWVDGRSSPRPADCRPRSRGSASSLASSLIGPNSILGELKSRNSAQAFYLRWRRDTTRRCY